MSCEWNAPHHDSNDLNLPPVTISKVHEYSYTPQRNISKSPKPTALIGANDETPKKSQSKLKTQPLAGVNRGVQTAYLGPNQVKCSPKRCISYMQACLWSVLVRFT